MISSRVSSLFIRVRSAKNFFYHSPPSAIRFWSILVGKWHVFQSKTLWPWRENVPPGCDPLYYLCHQTGRKASYSGSFHTGASIAMTFITPISSPWSSPCQGTLRIRDGYKVGWDRRCVLSIFKDFLHHHPATLHSFPRVRTMSSCLNQSSAFRHYIPSSQKYHIHHTPPTIPPPPARVGMQPYPPPQIRADRSSSEGHIKSYRPIKSAPTTTSARNCMPPPAKKISSSHRGSSSRKEYRFIQYSPR